MSADSTAGGRVRCSVAWRACVWLGCPGTHWCPARPTQAPRHAAPPTSHHAGLLMGINGVVTDGNGRIV